MKNIIIIITLIFFPYKILSQYSRIDTIYYNYADGTLNKTYFFSKKSIIEGKSSIFSKKNKYRLLNNSPEKWNKLISLVNLTKMRKLEKHQKNKKFRRNTFMTLISYNGEKIKTLNNHSKDDWNIVNNELVNQIKEIKIKKNEQEKIIELNKIKKKIYYSSKKKGEIKKFEPETYFQSDSYSFEKPKAKKPRRIGCTLKSRKKTIINKPIINKGNYINYICIKQLKDFKKAERLIKEYKKKNIKTDYVYDSKNKVYNIYLYKTHSIKEAIELKERINNSYKLNIKYKGKEYSTLNSVYIF